MIYLIHRVGRLDRPLGISLFHQLFKFLSNMKFLELRQTAWQVHDSTQRIKGLEIGKNLSIVAGVITNCLLLLNMLTGSPF